MTTTVLCHFYNEEYLLPWWLDHHAAIFDHGIMINYASTDSSVDIIRSKCPSWQIVDSRNEWFSANEIDAEVYELEADIKGPRLALNVTEFLYGDYNLLRSLGTEGFPDFVHIPCGFQVDTVYGRACDHSQPLITQLPKHGMSYSTYGGEYRQCRKAHVHHIPYLTGRHYWPPTTDDLMIYWHGFAPWNYRTVERRLQIGPRVPDQDRAQALGLEHTLPRRALMDKWKTWQDMSAPMADEIDRYLEISARSRDPRR